MIKNPNYDKNSIITLGKYRHSRKRRINNFDESKVDAKCGEEKNN
jgi:hypothetical protein